MLIFQNWHWKSIHNQNKRKALQVDKNQVPQEEIEAALKQPKAIISPYFLVARKDKIRIICQISKIYYKQIKARM